MAHNERINFMQEMTHRITDDLKLLAFENHDNCTVCNYSFKEGDTAHLGYDKNGKNLYVCDSCSSMLVETAVRYYFSPRPYKIPVNNTVLWRYMDFSKYMSLIIDSKLFFSRADCFDDAYEGAKGLIERKEIWDKHYLSFFKEAIKNPPEGYDCTKSETEINEDAKRLLLDLNNSGVSQRKRTFINCWHENPHESEAMWKLYSNYLENAIAIKTSMKSLYNALGKNPDINIGYVNYIDYSNKFVGINESFWFKRKSFEHEREVRAVISDFKCTEKVKLFHVT